LRSLLRPLPGKVVAALSLALWIGVIFLGRWVGFTTTAATEPGKDDIKIEEIETLLPK
jgi:hypothetical protein